MERLLTPKEEKDTQTWSHIEGRDEMIKIFYIEVRLTLLELGF